MKVVILCGGLGIRLSEETKKIPKPMVKIGGEPILVHILKIYYKFGFNDFILALGYKSNVIKNFFVKKKFKFKVKTVFTGKHTNTGGRILKLKKLLVKENNFMVTYGDGVTNQNIKKLLNFHLEKKKIGTMTVVRPPARFGEVTLNGDLINFFEEKPQISSGWINGGFFVFNKKIFKFIKKYSDMLEKAPLEGLVKKRQLVGYKHYGFWQCMDTLRDKHLLNKLIKNQKAPWMK